MKTLSLLKFLALSKNQHGIHSPFVYNLITKCFYNQKHFEAYELWEDVYQSHLASDVILQVENSESSYLASKSKRKTVSKLTKQNSMARKRARLMIRLVDYFSIQTALEFGTFVGLGSASIAGSGQVNLKTIESCPVTSAYAKSQFEKLELHNIKFINSSFAESFTALTSEEKFDLVFVSQHSQEQFSLWLFESLLKHFHNDSLLIIDGIYSSSSMIALWNKIKNHEDVQVTIDTYKWGFVFFRKEQVKQNFVIRV